MHQRVDGRGDESVVDEEVLLDVKVRMSAFEAAGEIAFGAMAHG